jgi:hypothetical protein
LITPLLILVVGIHPSTAVGTDRLYAAATKPVGLVAGGMVLVLPCRPRQYVAAN